MILKNVEMVEYVRTECLKHKRQAEEKGVNCHYVGIVAVENINMEDIEPVDFGYYHILLKPKGEQRFVHYLIATELYDKLVAYLQRKPEFPKFVKIEIVSGMGVDPDHMHYMIWGYFDYIPELEKILWESIFLYPVSTRLVLHDPVEAELVEGIQQVNAWVNKQMEEQGIVFDEEAMDEYELVNPETGLPICRLIGDRNGK